MFRQSDVGEQDFQYFRGNLSQYHHLELPVSDEHVKVICGLTAQSLYLWVFDSADIFLTCVAQLRFLGPVEQGSRSEPPFNFAANHFCQLACAGAAVRLLCCLMRLAPEWP